MKLILMMAQSVDGIIAKHNHHFPDWTSSADKKLFKRITSESGVLIMGSRTYITIGKPLPDRLNVVYTRHPERLPKGDNVVFTDKDPNMLIADLTRQGYKTAVLTGGTAVNSMFIRDQLIDEILLTIAPKLFGLGLSLFAEDIEVDLKLIESRLLDDDTVLVRYRVLK